MDSGRIEKNSIDSKSYQKTEENEKAHVKGLEGKMARGRIIKKVVDPHKITDLFQRHPKV